MFGSQKNIKKKYEVKKIEKKWKKRKNKEK